MSDLSEQPEVVSGNPLYDACVGFMVSERTGTDSWEKVARHTADLVGDGMNLAHIKATFKDTEAQVKKDFNVTQLPTAWRTAKSVALKAVKNGTPLLADDGSVLGKTATEKRVPRNNDDFALAFAIGKARSYAQHNEGWTKECLTKQVLVDAARNLTKELEAMPCA